MYEKLTKLSLLILLFFLQSCSGGKIGNFLLSSFQNIDQVELDNKEYNNFKNKEENNNLKKQIIDKKNKGNDVESKLVKSNNYKTKEKVQREENILKEKLILEDKLEVNTKKTLKSEAFKKRKKLKFESYRIIVILNDVDPTSPLENFSNVLRESNLDFEIENIQRYSTKQNNKRNNQEL